MMDKITSMKLFCRVAELGSFSAAARTAHLSTTRVSKHIARLEQSLGVALLNRTTRKVSLTEVGGSYYQRSKQLLDDLQELDSSISQQGGIIEGTLNISAPIDFGGMHMAPAIEAFQQIHPNVAIQLSLENRHIDLADGLFDVVIRITTAPEPGLVAKVIGSTALCTYASPGYIKKYGKPEHIEELQSHRCLHFLDTPHGENWIFQKENTLHRFRPKWRFASNNSRALCEAAVLDMGIIHAPDVSVAPYIKAGALQEILAEFRLPNLHIYATYLQRRFIPRKISSFAQFLAYYFEQHRRW